MIPADPSRKVAAGVVKSPAAAATHEVAPSASSPTRVGREVGRRIRELRLAREGQRMTQEELSERARISVSFLSMIERGERSPHLDTLANIAGALQVRLADLFLDGGAQRELEPVLRPLIEACRRYQVGKRDVERLVSVLRTMFA